MPPALAAASASTSFPTDNVGLNVELTTTNVEGPGR